MPGLRPSRNTRLWLSGFSPGNRFRVFYEIHPEKRQVQILAIGVKERERLLIGGVEVES